MTGRIGKWVQCPCGTAAVKAEFRQKKPLGRVFPGKALPVRTRPEPEDLPGGWITVKGRNPRAGRTNRARGKAPAAAPVRVARFRVFLGFAVWQGERGLLFCAAAFKTAADKEDVCSS